MNKWINCCSSEKRENFCVVKFLGRFKISFHQEAKLLKTKYLKSLKSRTLNQTHSDFLTKKKILFWYFVCCPEQSLNVRETNATCENKRALVSKNSGQGTLGVEGFKVTNPSFSCFTKADLFFKQMPYLDFVLFTRLHRLISTF